MLTCFTHPLKLTWNPKMKVWKIIFFFKREIFRFESLVFGGALKKWSIYLCLVALYPLGCLPQSQVQVGFSLNLIKASEL